MSADYISECPKCGEHELRCDDDIMFLDDPDWEKGSYKNSDIDLLVGKSVLRFLVARFECRCRGCDFRHYAEKVLDVLPDLNAPKPEEKCNHCHEVWGKGAEKKSFGSVDVCSRCHYTQ